MIDNPFAIHLGEPVAVAFLVEDPRYEPGAEHEGDHEWRQVIWNDNGRPDPDYAGCSCGQAARVLACGTCGWTAPSHVSYLKHTRTQRHDDWQGIPMTASPRPRLVR